MITEIKEPVFHILESLPSSLGCLSYNMVLFDRKHESEFLSRSKDLVDNIDDEENYHPFFLIHSNTSNGDPIILLNEDCQFSINRTDYDSILRFHCLAYQIKKDYIYLKSGFHSWILGSDNPEDLNRPYDWNSMDNMNGEIHFIVKLKIESFWKGYREVVKEWKSITKASRE